jgi:DNA polymerase
MSRRDTILEAMELGPLWRLRAKALTAERPEEEASRENERGAAAARAAKDDVPSPAPASAVVPPPAPDNTLTRARPESVESAEVVDRRSAILRMDWEGLKASVARCVACPLHEKRTNTVFGVGDEQADWLFVGEGPGAEEDVKGEPFVGQAGRLLDNMLAAIGLARGTNVYIANVVKCRPPGNRNPEAGEMHRCEPYLTRQILLLRPKLIVAMGRIAASHLLATNASIASLRGRLHDYQGTPLIVTYHPAYLLRNLPDKAKAWTDLCFATDAMAQIQSGRTNTID